MRSWHSHEHMPPSSAAFTQTRRTPSLPPLPLKPTHMLPASSRWVKGNNAELAQDADATLIKPRTGVAYQAWPVVWATIKESGVKSVSVQEVR